jgi:hypothetical protein
MSEEQTEKKEEPKSPLTYKDEETGDILYGYSQVNLNRLVKQMKLLTVVIIILGAIAFIGIFLVLLWLMTTNYPTRILEAILKLA